MSICMKSFQMGLAIGLSGKPLPLSKKTPIAYLYNGVQLPGLPEWDREAYPYAAICYYSDSDQYDLLVSSEPGHVYWAIINERVSMGSAFTWGQARINAGATEWSEVEIHADMGYAINFNVSGFIWCNHDILYPDDYSHDATLAGTVRFNASEPVPVYE